MSDHGLPELSPKVLHRLQHEGWSYKTGYWRDERTPLIPRTSRREANGGRMEVLRDFVSFTRLIEPTNRFASDELVRMDKIGPASNFLPCMQGHDGKPSWMDAADRFFTPHQINIDEDAGRYADGIVRSLSKAWHDEIIQPVTLDVASRRFQGKHDFGFPDFSSDPIYFDSHFEQSYVMMANRDRQRMLAHIPFAGMRTVSRGHVDGDPLPAKSRVLFRCARANNNVAKCWFEALFPRLKRHPSFAAWYGPRGVDLVMPHLMRNANGPILSGDFENFDASVSSIVIDRIFSIMKEWADPDAHWLLDLIQFDFNQCGLILPSYNNTRSLRVRFDRGGGIPSGHVLTNLVGSLVNMWSMAYACYKCGCRLAFCLVQGDDGVYAIDGNWSKEALSYELAKDTGLLLHADKSLVSDSRVLFCSMIHELGYLDGVGVRLFAQILNNAMSRERPGADDYELDVIRWISQWDDGKYHPCHESASHWLTLKLGQPMSVAALIRDSGGFLSACRAFHGGANEYNLALLNRLDSSKTVAAMHRAFDA